MTEPTGPVSAAVAHLTAAHPDLDHPDPVLRDLSWEAWQVELRRFLTDVGLVSAMGAEALAAHAFAQANRSLLDGGDGGPWLALLTEYTTGLDADRAVREAEGFLSGGADCGYSEDSR